MKLEHLFFGAPLRLFKQIATAVSPSSGGEKTNSKGVCLNGEVVYAAAIARIADVSYSHTSKIVKNFERLGLIKRIGEWGSKNIELKITPYGVKIWERLDAILEVMQIEN